MLSKLSPVTRIFPKLSHKSLTVHPHAIPVELVLQSHIHLLGHRVQKTMNTACNGPTLL